MKLDNFVFVCKLCGFGHPATEVEQKTNLEGEVLPGKETIKFPSTATTIGNAPNLPATKPWMIVCLQCPSKKIVSFYRNCGTKTYERVTEVNIESETVAEALSILQQEVKDNEHPVTVEVIGQNLYSNWTVGKKAYFDNYFWKVGT